MPSVQTSPPAGVPAGPLDLAYIVHDLADPAVARRLDLLAPHLARAVVIGFHRTATPPTTIAGWPTLPLGQTHDARLGRRTLSVALARLRLGRLRGAMDGITLVLSRQFETLVLARAARTRFAPQAVLAQECLDVHRLLASPRVPGRVLRWLEGRMLRGCDLVLVSSPGFVEQHLAPVHGTALPPVLLVENKVLPAEAPAGAPPAPTAGPPWRIGWFGMIRCRRSLVSLRDLVLRWPGQVEVVIRGRPALTAIPDFEAIVAATPGLHFHGPYDRRHDLARIYGEVHFTWAVDLFEAGTNSDWLLPNRLYEGTLHGAVPIALAHVQTGRWLAEAGIGVQLEAPLETSLPAWFAALSAAAWEAARRGVLAVPQSALVIGAQETAVLVAALSRQRL